MPLSASPHLVVALVFALLLAAFDLIFGAFLPLENGAVGADYSLAFPALLDGYFWFRNNGLAAPWFTPSFCAGQPAFADPQIAYYSLPQFLSFVVSPLAAVHLVLLICAAAMFWGGYLLMRKVFDSSTAAAVLVGGLLMFNGFLPHRMLIGHLGYHAFALAPWLALLLLAPARSAANGVAAAVGAGLLLAYWVHAGFGTLILAGGLAVALIALAYALRGGSLVHFAARGVLASLVGLGLSAAKLAASFSFLSHFERTYYALPGAASIVDGIVMIAGALLLPSQLAHEAGAPRLVNLQWALAPHEWAFNFGAVVVPLALALGIARWRTLRWRMLTPQRAALWGLLLLGLLWPLAFNIWTPGWNAFLKTVPFLNSASTPLRWLIIYIPILAVGLGLLLDRAGWGRAGTLAVALCLLGSVAQSAFEPRDYYRSYGYDARPVLLADDLARAGKLAPAIATLGTEAKLPVGQTSLALGRNDTFIAGTSQVFCYNPIFGYRLEKFSSDNLRPGSVLAEQGGFLNLKNPACYVFPAENHCRPGDRFRADQAAAAQDFVAYRPFPFEISARQQAANAVTLLTALAIGVATLVRFGRPSGTLPLAAMLSAAWLAACVVLAWVICVPLELPRLLFGATAEALGVALAKPREAVETTAFFLFVATWFPLAAWFVVRKQTRDGGHAGFWSVLPWAFLAALYLFAAEQTPYNPVPLKFSDWAFFQLFAARPLVNSVWAALLVGLALAAARGRPTARRLAEALSLAAFCGLALYAAWQTAFVAPSEGYALTWDTHHKSAVLAPIVDFMLSGETAKSQYGGYYVWVGAFAKLAASLGADPLAAIGAFFLLALLASFAAYGIAARIAAGSWAPALLALAAAIAFAGIRLRTFSYLQIEPIRWLFPALCLAAYAFVLRRGAPTRAQVAGLFALVPFALHWNPETGLACAGAMFFSLLVLPRTRAFLAALGVGLAGGGIALAGLLAAAKWYCADASAPAVAVPAAANSLFAFAFLDIFGAPMPLFHLWQLLWLLACVLFVAASMALRRGEAHAATIQLGAAMTLYLFFYYQGISVPGTLRALAFPLILTLAVVAYRALAAPRPGAFRDMPAARASAAVMVLPLACLAVLAPINSGSLGRTFDPFDMGPVAAEARTARSVCAVADQLANGKEVLYLSQDAWWYALSCGRPLNRGLVAASLLLSRADWDAWLARAGTAGTVVFEDGMLEFGKFGGRVAEIAQALEARGFHRVAIKDPTGHSLRVYAAENPATVTLRE